MAVPLPKLKANIKFSGLMDDPSIPDISLSSDWPKQIEEWQQSMHNLLRNLPKARANCRSTTNKLYLSGIPNTP